MCTAAEDDVTRRGGKNHQCCEPTTHGCGSDRVEFDGAAAPPDVLLATSPSLIVSLCDMPEATPFPERPRAESLECAFRHKSPIRPADVGRQPKRESLCLIRATESVRVRSLPSADAPRTKKQRDDGEKDFLQTRIQARPYRRSRGCCHQQQNSVRVRKMVVPVRRR